MHAITWAPGESQDLDLLFDSLREQQYNDRTHRYWQNYSKHMLTSCVACTIVFDQDQTPLVCSSIAHKQIWPRGAYRIYNRTWKPTERKEFLRSISPGMGTAGQSQISWLKRNTDCELYFISRETSNWQQWMIDSFDKDYNIQLHLSDFRYLTCECEQLDSCWQKIIYNGNRALLDQWKHQ